LNTQDIVPQQYLPNNLSTVEQRVEARNVSERNYNNRSANQAQMPVRRESISDKSKTE
jgi:hypothetical protein